MACDNLYDYIGRWMQYNWSHNDDSTDLAHPGTPLQKQNAIDIGLCFCIGVEEGYLILKTKHGIFRMKPWDKIELIPPSAFFWDDNVREVSRPKMQGMIDLILWDSCDRAYKYSILISGKRKPHYYSSRELVLCEQC